MIQNLNLKKWFRLEPINSFRTERTQQISKLNKLGKLFILVFNIITLKLGTVGSRLFDFFINLYDIYEI